MRNSLDDAELTELRSLERDVGKVVCPKIELQAEMFDADAESEAEGFVVAT